MGPTRGSASFRMQKPSQTSFMEEAQAAGTWGRAHAPEGGCTGLGPSQHHWGPEEEGGFCTWIPGPACRGL